MKETVCPNCGKPLTGDMVRSSNVPCQFRCGHCRERLYEYKVSAPIMLVSLAVIVLLIYLLLLLRNAAGSMIPAVQHVPMAIFALVCAYPVFIVSERMIAKYVIQNGNIIYRGKRKGT
ncbi:hypothetical protein [Bacillus inaquosorum]|uniref:hypothetical protein n=1 Tax=Bacillus inaquosorum TaxID=483913 RepID=UPI00228159C7|nr:hypothetical protein [Bacillus inaquosorum]MCY7949578.1 hypothetical protein [Bacillus inaquosorum]MEC0518164.1 hypothetical protein [Bacillus inaquosorum]MEC0606634.1 hypothetical protein [Bacillus inaquosorum]